MSALERLLRPIRQRISNIVVRGVVTMVNESGAFEQLQVRIRDGELMDDVEHWLPFGFASRVVPGAIPLLLAIGGHRAHTVAVCVDDPRYRPRDLQEGESVLYNRWGDEVRLKDGRIIAIKAGAAVEVEAPEIRTKGLLKHDGDIEATGDVKAGGISLLHHPHANGTKPDGTTGQPIPEVP